MNHVASLHAQVNGPLLVLIAFVESNKSGYIAKKKAHLSDRFSIEEATFDLKQSYVSEKLPNAKGWGEYVDTCAARIKAIQNQEIDEQEVITFNFSGNSIVAEMMKEDQLPHNGRINITSERLLELSKRYDVTVCARNQTTYIFLKEQSQFLPEL